MSSIKKEKGLGEDWKEWSFIHKRKLRILRSINQEISIIRVVPWIRSKSPNMTVWARKGKAVSLKDWVRGKVLVMSKNIYHN